MSNLFYSSIEFETAAEQLFRDREVGLFLNALGEAFTRRSDKKDYVGRDILPEDFDDNTREFLVALGDMIRADTNKQLQRGKKTKGRG